jgi:hypothetical protein
MTEPTSPVWTLAGNTADTVWAGRRGVTLPAVVDVHADGEVTAQPHPQPGAGTVRLVPSLSELTDEVVLDLLEVLIAIPGVRPAEVGVAAHHEVSVPLLAPSTIAHDRVEWTITDQLSLVHADRRDVYFAVAVQSRGSTGRAVVELTAAQTWLLVRALTTIRCWQFELETAFSAAATHHRTALMLAGVTAAAGPRAGSGA